MGFCVWLTGIPSSGKTTLAMDLQEQLRDKMGLKSTILDGDEVRENIRKVRELTDNPFGVNFLATSPALDELIEVIIDERVPVASYGRGDPAKIIEKTRSHGILNIPTVGAVRHAEKVVGYGADAVIVQGMVLEVAFSYAQKRNLSTWFSLGTVGFLSMYVNYALFSLIETYLVLNPFWVDKGFSGVLNYTFMEGSLAAIMCFFLISLGFALGRSLVPVFQQWQTLKVKTYGVVTAVTALGCWVLGFMLYR